MKYLIAANWKTHSPPQGAFDENSPYAPESLNVGVAVFPMDNDCKAAVDAHLWCGIQHAKTKERMDQARTDQCDLVLCGHSDRRINEHETDEMIAAQVEWALDAGLKPILCIGETLEEYEMQQTEAVLERQLEKVPLTHDVIIAYEPVWAIGTGKNAPPAYVEKIHKWIRKYVPDSTIKILYGGSVNTANALSLLTLQNVDGLLIGSASLQPDSFKQIIKTAEMIAN